MGEQELPDGWCTSEFKNIVSFVIGGVWGKDPGDMLDEDHQLVLCVRGGEIRNWQRDKGKTASLRAVKISSLKSRELILGDILLEISGGGPDQPVGRSVLIDDEVLNFESNLPKVCTNFLRLIRVSDSLNQKFINHYLQYFYISGEVIKYQGGSNNLRNLKYKEYETIKIPLPPLSEQNRIVHKLDRLFASLEILKTKLDAIPKLLKNFRQAVLSQAVTGKLTEEWREGKELDNLTFKEIESLREISKKAFIQNRGQKSYKYKAATKIELGGRTKGISELFDLPKSWAWVSIDQITYNISDGPHFSPEYVSPKIGKRFISMRNISYNGINFNGCKYVSTTDHDKFVERGRPEMGDVLLTKGGSTGIACTIDSDFDFSYWVHVALLKPIKGVVVSDYLKDALTSQLLYQQSQSLTHGVGNQDLGLLRMIFIAMPLPSFQEQQEIVSRVKSLFTKADTIEKQYSALQTKIDNLPQAILAKAFRGELVPQDPNDESASELLNRIKEIQNLVKKATKLSEVLA